MRSRFMVIWAARAVGITVAKPIGLDPHQFVGRQRLDLRHQQMRPLLFHQRTQGPASVMSMTWARCATCCAGASA